MRRTRSQSAAQNLPRTLESLEKSPKSEEQSHPTGRWEDMHYDSEDDLEEDREWEDFDSDDAHSESDEEIAWAFEEGFQLLEELEILECKEEELIRPLYRDVLLPSAFYTSPGWFQTGMENVSEPLILKMSKAEWLLDQANRHVTRLPNNSTTSF